MSKALATEPRTEETNAGLQQVMSGPQRFIQFLKETRQEMHKVVVPSRTEVQTTTIVVLVTVFLFAAYFELVDIVLGKGIDQVLVHLAKH